MGKRKFGKKNVIKVDPYEYNVGIIGESGVGKTTLMVEVLEKLVGEDGYMILNVGREDGIDAIPNAIYEDIKEFSDLEDFVEEVIENRDDYADLKVVVVDTIDELFRITEPEVVRLHNNSYPMDKQTTSVKGAFGGYQGGELKAVDIIIENLWKLNDIGIKVWFLGHTKRKTATDVMSGGEYDTLTSNMLPVYFNSIKTKLHVLGVASINRDIEKVKKKTKGVTKEVGVVTGESRIITFRDDNFNIDSKSRFAEIVDKINLDADEFIEALTTAIKKAHNKQRTKKSIEEVAKEQAVEREVKIKEAVTEIKEGFIDVDRNNELLAVVKKAFPKANDAIKAEVKAYLEENGFGLGDTSTTPTKHYEHILTLLKVEA